MVKLILLKDLRGHKVDFRAQSCAADNVVDLLEPANRRAEQPGQVRRVIDIMIIFFEGTGSGQEIFVSASVWSSRNWNFWVKSNRSRAVIGGRLQRPSPCLIRSAPRRERKWLLGETMEKRGNFCILNGTLQLFSGSSSMERLIE